jgi:uncharacterized protein (TIGR02996 family)
MTSEQVFLESIIAAPDDDGIRLIFADFLEEHGQAERAEFIRLMIERDRAGLRECSQFEGSCGKSQCRGFVSATTAIIRRSKAPTTIVERASAEALCLQPTALAPRHLACGQCRFCLATRRLDDLMNAGQHTSVFPFSHAMLIPSVLEQTSNLPDPCFFFQRGFPAVVTCSLAWWTQHGKEAVAHAPLEMAQLASDPLGTPYDFLEPHGILRMQAQLLRLLVSDDEPGDNPICRLHTLDLSRVGMTRWQMNEAMNQAYRPWRALRCLILPNWAELEERYRPYEIEQWKKRIPTLQSVQFGQPRPTAPVYDLWQVREAR